MRRTDDAVLVGARGVRHRRIPADAASGPARRRFGGLDLGAALAGALAAVGLTVLLGGLAAGAGWAGFRGADDSDLTTAGVLTGVGVLLVAFLTGGWVAGRTARYDGVPNGITAAGLYVVLTTVVLLLAGAIGSQADLLDRLRLPDWTAVADGPAAAGSALLGLLAALVAAAFGGALGSGYHRRADEVITRERPGGLLVGEGVELTRSWSARAPEEHDQEVRR